jgi:hypothetical protein
VLCNSCWCFSGGVILLPCWPSVISVCHSCFIWHLFCLVLCTAYHGTMVDGFQGRIVYEKVLWDTWTVCTLWTLLKVVLVRSKVFISLGGFYSLTRLVKFSKHLAQRLYWTQWYQGLVYQSASHSIDTPVHDIQRTQIRIQSMRRQCRMHNCKTDSESFLRYQFTDYKRSTKNVP